MTSTSIDIGEAYERVKRRFPNILARLHEAEKREDLELRALQEIEQMGHASPGYGHSCADIAKVALAMGVGRSLMDQLADLTSVTDTRPKGGDGEAGSGSAE
jgi:hypothetical protein